MKIIKTSDDYKDYLGKINSANNDEDDDVKKKEKKEDEDKKKEKEEDDDKNKEKEGEDKKETFKKIGIFFGAFESLFNVLYILDILVY